jgi:hypothetical protein
MGGVGIALNSELIWCGRFCSEAAKNEGSGLEWPVLSRVCCRNKCENIDSHWMFVGDGKKLGSGRAVCPSENAGPVVR